MKLLEHNEHTDELRHALMRFLNEFGLEAPAILSLARRTEPARYEPGEEILTQGEYSEHVYFLVEGTIVISIRSRERENTLGERGPVTVLGEISYFNRSPATATVKVAGRKPVVMLRVSYEEFTDVIDTYPGIRHALARIGEMRVISQYNGFASFRFFMDMIGWKRDRLAVNRPLMTHLEDAVTGALLTRLKRGERILEVGDGPGIVCEVIYEHHPDWLDGLHIQATHLEDAILNPVQPYLSDLTRARYLKERFRALVMLQVFNHIGAEQVGDHLALAARLLKRKGLLMVAQLRVVDISYHKSLTESRLVFDDLEALVRRLWPGALDGEPLVSVTFMDADFDPMMEWNETFCERVARGEVALPKGARGVEKPMLEVLLDQARQSIFNPDELHFHWLVWQAANHGFILEDAEQKPEVPFFYQLYRLQPDARPVRLFNHA